MSAADAYLDPVLGRDNLVVRTDAAVSTAWCSTVAGRVGVELVDGEIIDADHVVLAAGAIHCPAILLRSGVDTPGIGDGLQDHPVRAVHPAARSSPSPDPATRSSPARCSNTTDCRCCR